MTMGFNEFQRELQKREFDSKTSYILTLMYEQISELSTQMDAATKILLEMAKTMEGLTGLHEATQARLMDVVGKGQALGVDIKSVANEPED